MNLCTTFNYKKHRVVAMVDKKIKKEYSSSDLELNYDARVANIPHLNVGSVVESVSVEPSYFNAGTPDMFDVYDYVNLKRKYPALEQAWEHYQTVLKLCRAKEAEEKNEN
jgi:hypothetical protein